MQEEEGKSHGKGCEEPQKVNCRTTCRAPGVGFANPPAGDQGMGGHCEKPGEGHVREVQKALGNEHTTADGQQAFGWGGLTPDEFVGHQGQRMQTHPDKPCAERAGAGQLRP